MLRRGLLVKPGQKLLKALKVALHRLLLSRNHPLFAGTTAALLSLGLWQIGIWEPLEQVSYNALFQVREIGILPHVGWDSRIAVIAIDEASLRQYGQFPWRRDRYAELLQVLSTAPPAAIGFDILFTESTVEDETLAQAIAANWNVVLAVGADQQGNHLDPVPVLAAVAAQGHVLSSADLDGISRQSALYLGEFPSLSVALLQVYNHTLEQTVSADPSLRTAQPIPLPKPQSGQDFLWVNWPGSVSSHRSSEQDLAVYSFADVLQGKVDSEAFLNKLVLIGETATALDPLRSPLNFNPPISGVFLHAAITDNLLNDRWLRKLPDWATVLLLLALGPFTSLMLSKSGPRGRLAIALGLPVLWFGVALGAFYGNGWLPVAAPIGTILIAAGSMQWREQHEKQQLMNLFAIHVAPEMANLIWQHKGEIFQGGELRAQELTATVLFTDIRGFTKISEDLSSNQLLSWLNRYLDVMTECVMAHGGVVDKYIGDSIMAVFGIPFERSSQAEIQQDAVQAIAASLAMRDRLKVLNQEFAAEGKPVIEIGIGVHTGPVTAGSVGGRRRLNYSIVGDTVNTAARLESMNKEVLVDNPHNLLISGRTLAYVRDHYLTKSVKAIRLPGKEKATVVYAVLGKRSSG